MKLVYLLLSSIGLIKHLIIYFIATQIKTQNYNVLERVSNKVKRESKIYVCKIDENESNEMRFI